MSSTPKPFADRIDALRQSLVVQGALVREMVEHSFDSIFARDLELARKVIESDDEVDRIDLEVEQDAVNILCDVSKAADGLGADRLRELLVCVKVNNELERIADAAGVVAERVIELADRTTPFPESTRVITNSVIGIVRDAIGAFAGFDAERAKVVLRSEGAVLKFSDAIFRSSEQRVADGRMEPDVAFHLHHIVHQCELIADHCTNIAEQVIYAATGAVVRHTGGDWVEIDTPRPDLDTD
jgi:phosphate transport system protein